MYLCKDWGEIMCLSDSFPNTVTVTKFGAHEQRKRKKKKKQDFTECERRLKFSFSFFGSRSRCPTARAADSTRLWMCRVRETLPYHICQEQLKPDLPPCQHCRHLHSVHSEGEAIVWDTPGSQHLLLFLHMVSATSCHYGCFF